MNKKDITFKNVKAYVQGNLRYLMEEYGPEFLKMDKHIREQVMFRKDIANPECIKNGECTKCGCDIPQLFYADKQCGGKCYPLMMGDQDWKMFQKELSNYSLENQVEEISYPFDWNNILESSEVDSEDVSLMDDTKLQDINFDAGDVELGSKFDHTFIIKNDTDYNKRIIDVNTSCGCTTTNNLIGKYLPVGGQLEAKVIVDLSNKKKPGHKSVLTEIKLNNQTKIKLIIKFNIINNESD